MSRLFQENTQEANFENVLLTKEWTSQRPTETIFSIWRHILAATIAGKLTYVKWPVSHSLRHTSWRVNWKLANLNC